MYWSTVQLHCAVQVNCDPGQHGLSVAQCRARGCSWGPVEDTMVPWCYFPKDYGYMVNMQFRHGNIISLVHWIATARWRV